MSVEIVNAVRQKYPTPLGTQHREFLIEVACALGLGLVRKITGNFVPFPPPVNGVSQDVVMAADGRAWDILVDGDGEARASFNAIDPIDVSRFVPPSVAAPPPVPVAVPEPVSATPPAGAADQDLAGEVSRIRLLVERLCTHLGIPLT
jgi:hypothetical protein